jgi:hypothetical protein
MRQASTQDLAWGPKFEGREIMLWTIFVVLIVLWMLGFGFHIAGGLIHLLLVVAVILLVVNLLGGRRTFS